MVSEWLRQGSDTGSCRYQSGFQRFQRRNFDTFMKCYGSLSRQGFTVGSLEVFHGVRIARSDKLP